MKSQYYLLSCLFRFEEFWHERNMELHTNLACGSVLSSQVYPIKLPGGSTSNGSMPERHGQIHRFYFIDLEVLLYFRWDLRNSHCLGGSHTRRHGV